MERLVLLCLVILSYGDRENSLFASSEIHVGTFCTKHEDCIRYCAYSKYGPEAASCCFPEKIRISKQNWLATGSKTCYCCPSNPTDSSQLFSAEEPQVLTTPVTFGMLKNQTGNGDLCLSYLNKGSKSLDDVTSEFCRSGKCIQAMVIMKMSFEHPSLCRAKKFPGGKDQKDLEIDSS